MSGSMIRRVVAVSLFLAVIVVPRGFDEAKIPAILEQKKDWIADALATATERRRFFEEPSP